MTRTERNEVMAAKFTEREKRAIEAEAKKQGMAPSAYVRSAVMLMMCLDGNREALAMTATLVREGLLEKVAVLRGRLREAAA